MICIKYKNDAGDIVVLPFNGCCKVEKEQEQFRSQVEGSTYKEVRSSIMIDGHRYTSSLPTFADNAMEAICQAIAVGGGLVDLTVHQGEPELVTED